MAGPPVIIISYGALDESEVSAFEPLVVTVDENNRPIERLHGVQVGSRNKEALNPRGDTRLGNPALEALCPVPQTNRAISPTSWGWQKTKRCA